MQSRKDASGKKYPAYKKIKRLGEGAQGTAYLCERSTDKEQVVLKQIQIKEMKPDDKMKALVEAKILEVLKHPNIIGFLE